MGWLEIVGGIILGGAALVGVIVLVKIAFDAIRKWINNSIARHPDADSAVLIRQKLKDGKFRVVANIFDGRKSLDSQTWEGKEMDAELKAEFGRKNKIVYNLT
jgi:hypothetical protein